MVSQQDGVVTTGSILTSLMFADNVMSILVLGARWRYVWLVRRGLCDGGDDKICVA